MLIRTFDLNDQPAVIQLWQQNNLVVPWNDPIKDIEIKLNHNDDLFLVGERDGVIIATLMGGYDGHRAWVNYLAVNTSFQHRGYAREMLAYFESQLKQLNCPKINLLVRSNNQEIIAFYEHLGFKQDACVSLGKRIDG
ncbi:MAG: GNAT family acetyltransferase [Aliivibrio sp.]|uniref:GNAT family acetyltransferase n=1 Tax=Aliivibrio sp. TaxID=1872443 RepID=UPI001A45C3D6|nr:GNAT family acetyltransferase [Aliivibrio sp.]